MWKWDFNKERVSIAIKRTQFPLTLTWASTVHKVQDLSYQQGVIYFVLQRQKPFVPWQINTALSGGKISDDFYCLGEFKKFAIKVNKDALLEYERLKQNDLFSTAKRNTFSGDTVTVLLHNVRSLPMHVDDILSDNRIINNDIVGFKETQIKPSDSTYKMKKTFNLFNINSVSNENKFLSLAYECRNNFVVLNKFDANGVSVLSFKHAFAKRVFTLMLVYRKQSMQLHEFFQMLQFLLATYSIDIITGGFYYDHLKVSQNF